MEKLVEFQVVLLLTMLTTIQSPPHKKNTRQCPNTQWYSETWKLLIKTNPHDYKSFKMYPWGTRPNTDRGTHGLKLNRPKRANQPF